MKLPFFLFTASIITSSVTFAGKEDVNEYFDSIQPWSSVPFDRSDEPEKYRERREKALARHEENRIVAVGDLFPNEKSDRARAVMLDAMLDIPPARREDVVLAMSCMDCEDYLSAKDLMEYATQQRNGNALSRFFNAEGQLIHPKIFNQRNRFWIYYLGFNDINLRPYIELLAPIFGGKVKSDYVSTINEFHLPSSFDTFSEAIRVAKIEIAKKPKDFKGQMDIIEFMCGLARQGLRYIPKEEIATQPAAVQQSAVSMREFTRDFREHEGLLDSLSAQAETDTKD